MSTQVVTSTQVLKWLAHRPAQLAGSVVCAAGLLLSSPLLAAGTDRFPDDASIERELRHFVQVHHGAPGVVVGLIDASGRRVIAFGDSGRAERPQLDAATRFEIGSISKTFTGLLLASMIASAEVSAEQPVSTLFPAAIPLSNGVQDASLEALATHTSGLPRIAVDLRSLARTLSLDPYRGTDAEDVFASVASVPSTRENRSQDLAYSNLGFALLGRLLEQRVGQPYELLLRQRVLEPFGLDAIAIAHDQAEGFELAVGHGPGGRPTPYWHVDGYTPAGGLIASADDLLDYLTIQLDASNPVVAEAQRQRKTFADGKGIGLAWMHSQLAGHRLVWHDGITGGFRSIVVFLPQEGRALVVLANGQGDVNALANRLIDSTQPSLSPFDESAMGYLITLGLLAWGPLLLLQSSRQASQFIRTACLPAVPELSSAGGTSLHPGARPSRIKIDRWDVLRRWLSPAIALVLAERLGAWQEVPFITWWFALALSLVCYAALVRLAPQLPGRRAGIWSAIGRSLTTALELCVLALLFF